MSSHPGEPATEAQPHDADGSTAHRHERPEDWGWHAQLSGLARFGGWFTLFALALMLTATHYNHAGTVAIVLCMLGVIGGLIWDYQQRRTSWRR